MIKYIDPLIKYLSNRKLFNSYKHFHFVGLHNDFEIISMDDINTVLNDYDRWTSEQIRFANTKKIVTKELWLRQDIESLDLNQFYNLIKEHTLVLQYIDKTFPKVNEICQNIEQELSLFGNASLFISNSNSKSFSIHADNYHLFSFQLKGSRSWKIYSSLDESNIKRYNLGAIYEGDKLSNYTDVKVQKGDVLYLPPGTFHQAYSSETNIHLVCAFHQLSKWDIFQYLYRFYNETNIPKEMWSPSMKFCNLENANADLLNITNLDDILQTTFKSDAFKDFLFQNIRDEMRYDRSKIEIEKILNFEIFKN